MGANADQSTEISGLAGASHAVMWPAAGRRRLRVGAGWRPSDFMTSRIAEETAGDEDRLAAPFQDQQRWPSAAGTDVGGHRRTGQLGPMRSGFDKGTAANPARLHPTTAVVAVRNLRPAQAH